MRRKRNRKGKEKNVAKRRVIKSVSDNAFFWRSSWSFPCERLIQRKIPVYLINEDYCHVCNKLLTAKCDADGKEIYSVTCYTTTNCSLKDSDLQC